MALSNEDKKDVKKTLGSKMANKVSRVTHDSWSAQEREDAIAARNLKSTVSKHKASRSFDRVMSTGSMDKKKSVASKMKKSKDHWFTKNGIRYTHDDIPL